MMMVEAVKAEALLLLLGVLSEELHLELLWGSASLSCTASSPINIIVPLRKCCFAKYTICLWTGLANSSQRTFPFHFIEKISRSSQRPLLLFYDLHWNAGLTPASKNDWFSQLIKKQWCGSNNWLIQWIEKLFIFCKLKSKISLSIAVWHRPWDWCIHRNVHMGDFPHLGSHGLPKRLPPFLPFLAPHHHQSSSLLGKWTIIGTESCSTTSLIPPCWTDAVCLANITSCCTILLE